LTQWVIQSNNWVTHSSLPVNSAPSLPLAGLRVLDFSSMMAGPYCGRWLADLGADVIKIEAPEGDYMRSRPPRRGGESAYFGHLNCGKRSIVLDLKNREAQRLARELARTADVIVEGARPGVMQRLGLDYARLAADCPRLVYCSISGWGQQGPRAQQPAYAAIVHAATGFDAAWQAGQQDASQPPACAVQIADVVAASFALNGIQSALLARAATGRGQHVDLSLAEGMLALMPLELVQAQLDTPLARTSYRATRAADGHFVATPISQQNFESLCDAMERPALKQDERFATPGARVQHWEELLAELADWAAGRGAAECVATLERAGVPASVYGTVRDAIADPQIRARGFLGEAIDGGGRYRVASLPFQLGGSRAPVQARRVPALGEHTAEVLREVLHLDAASLNQLATRGAFGRVPLYQPA
jgi:crotonobetainyl-CoA:carnitine CoA-transferase CaiB-like acyl-CoA transferase